MFKTSFPLLLLAFSIAGCGSDSNPEAPAPSPLQKADLLGIWQGKTSSITLDWNNFNGLPETRSLTDVNFKLIIEDVSYRLTVESYTGSDQYNAEEWGFWEIEDATKGTMSFSPQHEEKKLVWEYQGRNVSEKHTGQRNINWTCEASSGDSTLLLTGLPSLLSLHTESLNLKRKTN